MEEKWPLLLMVVAMLFGLGWVMAGLERNTVIRHWETRRCQLPVMVAARFFKPDGDPRTPSQFSSDNYEFCVKTFVDQFMEMLMAPVVAVMGKQANMTEGTSSMLNTVRGMAQTMFTAFSSYLGTFFKRFHHSVFELNRIMVHLKMAAQRMSATVMSMLFAGMTLFRTMINSIQVVIRVVLIICTIMIAIMILLFFVLFPFIPMIMSTLSAVVVVVLALSAVMSQSIAADAESKKSGFCFAEGSLVVLRDGTTKPVESIRVGDELQSTDPLQPVNRVTVTMEMNGAEIRLYEMEGHGMYVTGSHLIQSATTKEWIPVSCDPRAARSDVVSPRIYCFNTTQQVIPLQSASDPNAVFLFRDWEELPQDDATGQILWNHMILTMLNKEKTSTAWQQDRHYSSEVPLLHPGCAILCRDPSTDSVYTVPLSELKIGDWIASEKGTVTQVTGIIEGLVEQEDAVANEVADANVVADANAKTDDAIEWATASYGWSIEDRCWRRIPSVGLPRGKGRYLITESGTFLRCMTSTMNTTLVRDFTEVGVDRIHETYSFIESRVR